MNMKESRNWGISNKHASDASKSHCIEALEKIHTKREERTIHTDRSRTGEMSIAYGLPKQQKFRPASQGSTSIS